MQCGSYVPSLKKKKSATYSRVLAQSIMVIDIGHGFFAVCHLTEMSKGLRPDISVQQCMHLPVVLLGGWLL